MTTGMLLAVLATGIHAGVEPAPALASADAFVVNTADDLVSGDGCSVAHCSLREAIHAANGDIGLSRITFDGRTGGVVLLETRLPEILDPAHVDGSMGTSTAAVEIRPRAGACINDGLRLVGSGHTVEYLRLAGFYSHGIEAGRRWPRGPVVGSTLRGNVIHDLRFGGPDPTGIGVYGHDNTIVDNQVSGTDWGVSDRGIVVWCPDGTGDNLIARNRVGPSAHGGDKLSYGITAGCRGDVIADNVLVGNHTNLTARGADAYEPVRVSGNVLSDGGIGLLLSGPGIVVGGDDLDERNVITRNGTGIYTFASDVRIVGNWIGTDASGTAGLGNTSTGILVRTGVRVVISGNVIAGNGNERWGAAIDDTYNDGSEYPAAEDVLIEGNLIGTTADGDPLGTIGEGIYLLHTRAVITGNTIVHSTKQGIYASSATIVRNVITANGRLGIDVGLPGVSPNDPLDADTLSPNHPELRRLKLRGSAPSVIGTLHTSPSTSLVIDVYVNDECDVSGYGEGERWIGTATVGTDARGDAEFSIKLAEVPTGHLVATASGPDGTSEFSACLPAV